MLVAGAHLFEVISPAQVLLSLADPIHGGDVACLQLPSVISLRAATMSGAVRFRPGPPPTTGSQLAGRQRMRSPGYNYVLICDKNRLPFVEAVLRQWPH